MATGNYAGDGSSNRIINAFGTGVTVREVLIAKNNGEKIIAFMWNPSTGEQIAWDQATNTEYSTDAVRFSGNTFIVGGTHTNKAPDPVTHYYYWIAYGTWNP